MCRHRSIWFYVCCYLMLLGSVCSQSLAQTSPTATSTEALIQEASQALAAQQAITTRLEELLAREAELRGRLSANSLEREALAIPDAPSMDVFPADSAAGEALLAAWEQQLAVFEQRQGLNEARLGLAREHRDVALMLADETRLAAAAQAALEPLLGALQERLSTEGDTGIELPEPLQLALDAEVVTTAPFQDTDWAAVAARNGVLIEETRADQAALNEQIATAQQGQQQTTVWLQELTLRQQLRQEFQAQETTDLLARLGSGLGEWPSTLAALEERGQFFTESTAELAQQVTALEALEPPSLESVADAATAAIESLRLAQQNLALAEASINFQQQRQTGLQEVREATVALMEQRTTLRESLERTLDEGVKLAVIAQLLQDRSAESGEPLDLPDASQDGSLNQQLSQLRNGRRALQDQQLQAEAKIAALDETLDVIASARQEAALAAEEAQAALEREQRWVSFIQEVESLDNDQLLAAFADTLAELAAAEEIAAEFNEGLALTQEQMEIAWQAYRANLDPVVVTAVQRNEAFSEWYQSQGLELLADPEAEPAPEEISTTDAAATAAADATDDAAQESVTSPAEQWLSETRDYRDQQIVRRLNYYQESAELRTQLLNTITNHGYALQQRRDNTANTLELARRAWGSASALNARVQQGELDAAQLPAEIGDWETREQVLSLQEQMDSLARQIAEMEAALQALAGTAMSGYDTPLENWASDLTQQTEQLSDYLGLVEQFSAIESREELGELEARMLEREIIERIRADLGVYDALDNFFATSETQTLDELLRRYYERLILLERRVANLDNRKEVLRTLVERVEATREHREALLEAIATTIEEAEARLDTRLTAVRVALNPNDAATLLADYEERTGSPLAPAQIPRLPTEGDEAEQRQARNELVMSLQQPWARLSGYRAWQTQLREDLTELGLVVSYTTEIRDLIARLDAERLDYQRRITRLVGYSEAELQTLAVSQEEFTGDTLGEIDRLQIERRRAVNWRAAESTAFLVLIPIAALLAILFMRRAGRKLVDRVVRRGDGRKAPSEQEIAERELRANTLLDIFGTLWNVIIIGLAVIYMLKVVNIDVTPILASLGIFGLAVAFGAQAIMKDLFTGFFLLLENQMNRGEWVTVNGIVGQVESIGLRITKVREFVYGGLHYIPNGQITSVESWDRGLGKDRIRVSVPLSEDHRRVQKILADLLAEMQADPAKGHTLSGSYISSGIKSFDIVEGAMTFEVWLVFTEGNWGSGRIYRQRLKEIFEAEGIPFAVPAKQIQLAQPLQTGDAH